MSKQLNDTNARAEEQLTAYLEEAMSAGAESISLEYVPEGLEVMSMLGDTGAGRVLKDAKLAGALMRLIGERTGLDTKATGTITWDIHGQPLKIAVEEYASFGECAFRLKLKRASGKCRRQ